MRFLKGGMVLLNLTAITLGLTSGETSITNEGILKELTELRNFIDANEDFSGKSKGLKPVILEYRSSASEFHGIAQGSLSFHTDALHMSIGANVMQADGTSLAIIINVVYEWTDYIGYTVKTATVNATKDVRSFEDIVDKDGHKRFIEGDIETPTQEGVSYQYAKWSLSGSHLMIVIAGTVTEGHSASVSLNTPIPLPSWVKSKLVPLGSGDNIVYSAVNIYDNTTATATSASAILVKSGDSVLIYHQAITPAEGSDSVSFRMQFDLLIDNSDD